MGNLKVLPKRFDELDALGDDCYFRINIDVLNEAFGVGRAMYAKACYPDKRNTYFLGNKPSDRFMIWMPKLYGNSSEWKNSISEDGSMIYEIAEASKHKDWTEKGHIDTDVLRIVFAKPSPSEPYKFVGIFETNKLDYLKHSYKRIATKIELIGTPVNKIKLLDDIR